MNPHTHVKVPTCLCQLHWGWSREVGAFRLSCCAALEEPAACIPVLCFSRYAAASSFTRDLRCDQLYTCADTHLQIQSGWYDTHLHKVRQLELTNIGRLTPASHIYGSKLHKHTQLPQQQVGQT